MSEAHEEEELDLARALGANAPSSVQVLTLYVPSKDRHDRDLPDQRKWVMEAAEILARIGGGVTILPPVEGGWVAENGQIIWEHPVVLYTYVRVEQLLATLSRLRRFLHRMGREPSRVKWRSSSMAASTGSSPSTRRSLPRRRRRRMTRRVRDTSAREKRLRDTGSRERRVEPADLAKALGAEPVGRAEAPPIFSVAGLYRELAERLRSTGGRPSLEGATRRQKIPLTDADWDELERLSERLNATPGQIASVLLHQVLANLDPAEAEALLKKKA